ncbi:MAG: peptide chain release factor N(5)-glutamine methyltransferase [Gammaproteobacteria bacterium]|nr:peptide chain release factor N(5)-glutamine methyltransferase [Gammaproteobacteria bacterium]
MTRTGKPVTIAHLLAQATARLNTDTARLDAEVLLAHVLDKPRSHLFAWPDNTLDDTQLQRFEQALARRLAGEPVAHLTGQREFWSLPLRVTQDTLIPRPETETLVTQALDVIPTGSQLAIADLGTGSGAVALAIASERPDCRVVATDSSAAALAVARSNAQTLHTNNIEFLQGDWCTALQGTFDLVVSNPPYIAALDPHLETGDVRFEPRSALAAGETGMDALGAIAHCAAEHLNAGGWLMMEHGYDQSDAARKLLESAGYRDIDDIRDDAGLDRVIRGRK